MSTWNELGRKALEELGALPLGSPFETTAQEKSTLARFKDILDGFVVQGYIIPGYERIEYTITAPVQVSYTMGPGRDIDTPTPPTRIKDVSYDSANLIDPYTLTEIDFATFQERRWPKRYGLYPVEFYYELNGAFGTLWFSTNTTPGDKVQITWPRFLLPDGALVPTDEAVIPLGWARFMYLALAADLLNVYMVDRQKARDIRLKAGEARADVLDNNSVAPAIKVDDMFIPQGRSMMDTRRGFWWR